MKKIFSSVFVGLIFLNVMGYYGLLLGLKYNNARDMISRLNAGLYSSTDTETLKIPFKAPDAFYSEVYERVDGDFEKNGEVYRLVKQRLYRDTFHIVYIKDITGTAIDHAMDDLVQTFSDVPSEKKQDSKIILVFLKEYFVRHFSIQPISPGWENLARLESHEPVFVDQFTSSIIHPPERNKSIL